MTYEESAALMADAQFRGRIKVAAIKFADAIIGEPETTAAHQTRLRWAQDTFRQPDLAAMQLQPPVVMDAAVQSAGANIDDGGLQAAVETVVNKML